MLVQSVQGDGIDTNLVFETVQTEHDDLLDSSVDAVASSDRFDCRSHAA